MGMPTTSREAARPETKAWYFYREVDRMVALGATEETATRLASARIIKSRRNTHAIEEGGVAYNLTKRECELLGRVPGPGND